MVNVGYQHFWTDSHCPNRSEPTHHPLLPVSFLWQQCTVWKVVNDTLKKLTANLTTQLYSKFQSNLRKDLPLQNGFIGPLDYKFMYLVHATPPYNCDLELGQNHYIKWHFCSFQINFLLCLVYKLVKKTSDWWHTDHNKSPQKGIGKKYEIELLCRDAT